MRLLTGAALAMLLAGCSAPAPNYGAAYSDYVAWARAKGRLRTDYAPADAPYSNADLARNFERVVFFSEYARVDDIDENPSPTRLSRWASPVRYLTTGAGVEPADRAEADALAARFHRLTRLSFTRVDELPNLIILIGDYRARLRYAHELRRKAGDQTYIAAIERDLVSEPCFGFLFSQNENPSVITGGLIVIKAETRGLLRKSCLHEEFAQVLGPQNDSDEIRPSLFNDGNEFALLTEHDEMLLRVLYDPRLMPGMSATHAQPIIRQIIAELRPGHEGPGGGPNPLDAEEES